MGYEFWLSIRYLFAKRRERFISLSAVLSIGGVALGVAVLLIALAIMSGLHNGLKERFVGINTHIIIEFCIIAYCNFSIVFCANFIRV